MKKKLIGFSGAVLGFTPLLAFAQTPCASVTQPGTLNYTICRIGDILDTIIPILVILGVVYFVWGVVMYVISSDEEAKAKGRTTMIYGIIGLVVIVAMWGLVGIIDRTFGLGGQTGAPILPTVPF